MRGGVADVWQLSGTATRRFFNLPYARYMLPVPGRQMIVRVMSFTTLAWGGWLANGPGTAVCGLTGARAPRRRLAAVAVCVVAGVAALAGWMGWVAAVGSRRAHYRTGAHLRGVRRANAVAGVACGPRWKSEVQARQIELRRRAADARSNGFPGPPGGSPYGRQRGTRGGARSAGRGRR